jgi:hypothetical protein
VVGSARPRAITLQREANGTSFRARHDGFPATFRINAKRMPALLRELGVVVPAASADPKRQN